jgi:hypothetical protein
MEKLLSRRSALALGTAAVALPQIGGIAAAAKPLVMVELFTSQGCSSCPPADRIAGALTKRDDVIVVSLNVDYWDYLGWKDTLAKPEFTKRQMDYAHQRGDGDVYTPQMVINGAHHVVGSRDSAIKDAIVAAAPAAVPVSIDATKNEIVISAGDGEARDATLWLMAVTPSVEVEISRGENSGSTFTYHNVVRNLVPAGMWKGKAQRFVMPRKAIVSGKNAMCIAVLQEGETGPVLGLASWTEGAA